MEVGPDAPTLCEGWLTADLAAHLVIRERRPDAAPGLVLPALSGYMDRVQRSVRDRYSWPELVAKVRSGPPLPLRPRFVDQPMNAAEFFVHHEDVRRAGPGWAPREADPELDRALWSRVRLMARPTRKAVSTGLTLVAPDYGRVAVRPGDPMVTATGPPGELLLLVSGRQQASRCTLTGDPEDVDALRQAKLGI